MKNVKVTERRPRLTLFFFDVDLETDREYTSEELLTDIKDITATHQANHINTPFTKITLESTTDSDPYSYDNCSYARFRLRFYREETDQEYTNRILREDQAEAKKNVEKKQALEKARLKKEQDELRAVDPEYQKFLELKKKFK